MRLKTKFESENINGERVFVAIDSDVLNGLIRANGTASFILDRLAEDVTIHELISMVVMAYDVDRDKAHSAVERIVEQLRKLNLIEE